MVEALEPQAVPFLLASLLKTFAYIRLKVHHCARLQTRSKMKNMYYYFKCIDFNVTFPYGLIGVIDIRAIALILVYACIMTDWEIQNYSPTFLFLSCVKGVQYVYKIYK